MPKHPEVVVQLTGKNGNAFVILGACRREARRFIDESAVRNFQVEATAGDYDHLLATCRNWFTVK